MNSIDKKLARIEDKIARNKPKKVNKGKKNKTKIPTKLIRSFAKYFGNRDPLLEVSVHRAVNSFFFPSLGIFRGQGKAFARSALATIKGSIVTSNAVALNNVFAVRFSPGVICSANWLVYGYGTTAVAALSTSAAALMSTTQAESYRVVSAELTLTPQGSLLNQAGSGLTGYVSDYTGFTSLPNDIATLALVRPFKAVDTQIWHWLPSENSVMDETEFQPTTASTVGSGISGFINIPSASDQLTTWQIDYSIGVEYIPSPTYRPFVEKASPTQDMRTQQHINLIADVHWKPLMIGTIQEYNNELVLHEAMEGSNRNFSQLETLYQRHEGASVLNKAGNVAVNLGQAANVGAEMLANTAINFANSFIPGNRLDIPLFDEISNF